MPAMISPTKLNVYPHSTTRYQRYPCCIVGCGAYSPMSQHSQLGMFCVYHWRRYEIAERFVASMASWRFNVSKEALKAVWSKAIALIRQESDDGIEEALMSLILSSEQTMESEEIA